LQEFQKQLEEFPVTILQEQEAQIFKEVRSGYFDLISSVYSYIHDNKAFFEVLRRNKNNNAALGKIVSLEKLRILLESVSKIAAASIDVIKVLRKFNDAMEHNDYYALQKRNGKIKIGVGIGICIVGIVFIIVLPLAAPIELAIAGISGMSIGAVLPGIVSIATGAMQLKAASDGQLIIEKSEEMKKHINAVLQHAENHHEKLDIIKILHENGLDITNDIDIVCNSFNDLWNIVMNSLEKY